MKMLRRFLLRLVSVVRRDTDERELADEIATHVALMEEDLRQKGLSADEARRTARLALGGIEQVKDRHRDARSFAWLDDARRDVAHAVRLFRHHPLFVLTATLSLAIGIGANTAIFTLANALLLRDPIGVTEPHRLVDIGTIRGDNGFNPAGYPAYLDIRQHATLLDSVYAQTMFPESMSLGVGGNPAGPERVFGHFVTTNYFMALGVTPAAGRLFDTRDSDRPGASPIAVLSHRFWTRRFNQDPAIFGHVALLNGQPFTIVGVAPEGFQGTGIMADDLWLPLNMIGTSDPTAASLEDRDGAWLIIGARLKPGVTDEQASAEISALGVALKREHPNSPNGRGLALQPSSRVPGNHNIIRGFLVALMVIVALVLIVACANVAGILMARAATRRREIAVRLSIGAGRGRLVRQLLTETMALFLIGGGAGLLLARVMTRLLVPQLPSLPFPVSVTLALDGRVIAFTIGLSLVSAVLAGLVPALQASKADVVTALKADSQGPSRRTRLQHAFVITQIAFTLVLIVTAGLFVRALRQAGYADPGFAPHGVELASLDLSAAGYTDSTGARAARDLLDRVRLQPEVRSATMARVLPGGFEGIGLGGVTVPGYVPPPDDAPESFTLSWNIVEPGYFATLEIPLVAGRDFGAADVPGAQPVAIVSEGVARRFWPGQNAIGKSFSLEAGASVSGPRDLVVVGVARDVKSSSLIDGLAGAFIYLPLQQRYQTSMTSKMTLAVRTTHGQPITNELRALAASLNPNLTIVSSGTLEESTALGLATQRVVASISGSLGSVGLLLAAIGIYGVTAYAVARRTREIGIRIALGAPRHRIVRMVLGQGMLLAAIGSAIGFTMAAIVSQGLSGFLFGVPPLDPITFGGTALLFTIVGLAACYVPARRATRVDPLIALGSE